MFQAHNAAVEAGWTVGKMRRYMRDMAKRYEESLSSELLLKGIIDGIIDQAEEHSPTSSCCNAV